MAHRTVSLHDEYFEFRERRPSGDRNRRARNLSLEVQTQQAAVAMLTLRSRWKTAEAVVSFFDNPLASGTGLPASTTMLRPSYGDDHDG
jgi:hypothetical protein